MTGWAHHYLYWNPSSNKGVKRGFNTINDDTYFGCTILFTFSWPPHTRPEPSSSCGRPSSCCSRARWIYLRSFSSLYILLSKLLLNYKHKRGIYLYSIYLTTYDMVIPYMVIPYVHFFCCVKYQTHTHTHTHTFFSPPPLLFFSKTCLSHLVRFYWCSPSAASHVAVRSLVSLTNNCRLLLL